MSTMFNKPEAPKIGNRNNKAKARPAAPWSGMQHTGMQRGGKAVPAVCAARAMVCAPGGTAN